MTSAIKYCNNCKHSERKVVDFKMMGPKKSRFTLECSCQQQRIVAIFENENIQAVEKQITIESYEFFNYAPKESWQPSQDNAVKCKMSDGRIITFYYRCSVLDIETFPDPLKPIVDGLVATSDGISRMLGAVAKAFVVEK